MSSPHPKDATGVIDDDPNEQYFRTDDLRSDLKGRTVRGGVLMIMSSGLKQLLWITGTIVLARLLTPEDTGLIAMVLAITSCIEIFSDMGLSAATVQRERINQAQVSALFWINSVLGIGLMLLTAALAPLIAWFYAEPRLVWVTVAVGSGFLFSGLTIQHRALLRRQMRFRALAVTDVIVVGAGTGIGIVAALAGTGYWALVLSQIAAVPIDVLLIWSICRWRPSRPALAEDVRGMVVFGSNLTGYRLLTYVMRNVDNVLIGWLYGPLQLGLYSKAYNLLLIPLQRVTFPLAAVSQPALSRLTDSPEQYRAAFVNIASKVGLLTMPLMALLIGTSDWLVLVVLGPQWVEASRMFAWLGISGLLEPLTIMTVWLFMTQGRVGEQFRWGIIASTLTIAAIVAGLPWGPVGVAAAYGIVGSCVRAPLLFWYVGRKGPVRVSDLYSILAPLILVAGLVLAAVVALRLSLPDINPLIGLVLASGLAIVVTGTTLIALPWGRTTIRDAGSIIKTLISRPA
jgi:PST family polysaccharide transporter